MARRSGSGFPFKLITLIGILFALPLAILLVQQQQNLQQDAFYRRIVRPTPTSFYKRIPTRTPTPWGYRTPTPTRVPTKAPTRTPTPAVYKTPTPTKSPIFFFR